MTSQNIATIRAAYAGFASHDIERVLAAMWPDVEWVHPEGMGGELGGTKLGHAGIRDFMAHVPSVLGGMRLNPVEFIEAGDRVVVFGTREVTSHRGTTGTLDFVHSWTMREGRAARMEDIFDTVIFHRLIES
ncbi:nuclear transport factor 2 family protein [Streptomyces sp. NPDC057702]|uniref:nuclear transport factor 2 family protein n=1 Tax=unclassified Streptomyces TaxID=2593676 RepID=UPI00367C8762